MSERDRSYTNLDKDMLVHILDNVPEGAVKLATVFAKVTESREKDPARLWEEEYRKIFQVAKKYADIPPHKIEWFLEAVDLVGRSLQEAPGQTLCRREIEDIFRISGIFSKRYVNPEIERIYKNKSNWELKSGYEDNVYSVYIGDPRIRKLVEDDSRFDHDDMYQILTTMNMHGHISDAGDIIQTFRLGESK